MTKPPPTTDRIVLLIREEVSVTEAGPRLAQLAQMGFHDVRYELVTDVHAFATKTRKTHLKEGDTGHEDFLLAWAIEYGRPFSAGEARAYFDSQGRAYKDSVYGALKRMTDKGIMKKLKNRTYVVMKAAAKAAAKQPNKSRGGARTLYEVSNYDFVANAITAHGGTADSTALKEAFAAAGRPTTSVRPVLTKMLARKSVKRTGDGSYALAKPNGAAS
jgi:hypothetical protein